MPLPVDEIPTYIGKVVDVILRTWDESSSSQQAPAEVRSAVEELRQAKGAGSELVPAAQALVRSAASLTLDECEWCPRELYALLPALNSALRQHAYSDRAKVVLRLCDEISKAASEQELEKAVATRLVAALMVVEDATSAIESYRSCCTFNYVDDAYLAKFGLLQALQLGFDAAQRVCRELGIDARADATSEGKSVKVTRHIVAGHPLGGTMRGHNWQHFHDRASAHDQSVISIMSFLDSDPTNWSGQTQSTDELMANGLEVFSELLGQARSQLPATVSERASGLLFPAHDWSKRNDMGSKR